MLANSSGYLPSMTARPASNAFEMEFGYGQVQQQPMQNAYMQQQYMRDQRRNAVGDKLFYIIKDQLEKTVADRKEASLDHPKITPGLITGMLLENDLDEAEKLITDTEGLGERMIEACEAIIEKFGI